MKFETDKNMVVFNGTLKSIALIETGEYEVKKIKPLDNDNKKLTWYQIKGTSHIFALNRRNLPKGLALKGGLYKKQKPSAQ